MVVPDVILEFPIGASRLNEPRDEEECPCAYDLVAHRASASDERVRGRGAPLALLLPAVLRSPADAAAARSFVLIRFPPLSARSASAAQRRSVP